MSKHNKKHSLQNAYLSDVLTSRTNAYETIIKRVLKEIPEDYHETDSLFITDSLLTNVLTKINKEIKAFNKIFALKTLNKKVSNFINKKIVDRNKKEYKRFIRSQKSLKARFNKIELEEGLKIDDVIDSEQLQEFTKDAIVHNVELIKSLDSSTFADIKKNVSLSLTGKLNKKELIKSLGELGTKSKAQAELIAVDQTNKIYENLNTKRNESLGAKEFKWLSSSQNNVRSEHASYHGKVFTYKKGAGKRGILPGQDVRCNCTALPIFEDEE